MHHAHVTAAAAPADVDPDSRTLRGLLIPWDTPGNTSIGRVRFRPDSVKWPATLSRVKLTREHDRTAPRGYGTEIANESDGLRGAFHVAATPEGDLALQEAAELIRDGLSVDLDNVEIRGGWVESAELVAVGQVAVPAFADSRIAASDAGADDDDDETPAADEAENPEAPAVEPAEQEDDMPENATVPVGLRATREDAPAPQGITDMAQLYAALSAQHVGRATPEITAALQNITNTANKWAAPTQYEGELWSGVVYNRRIVPLLTSKSLTGWTVNGWRWKTPPIVSTYAGDKTAVPSNPAVTEAVTVDAVRLAGAHDIDRKYRDFNDTGFFSSYYDAMAASYAKESDNAAMAALTAGATAFTPTGTTPSAFDILVQMCVALVAAGGNPSFAIVGADVYKQLALTTAQAAPLDTSILPPRTVAPPAYDPDDIIVGDKNAVSFYELPGSPIRVEAIDMVNGGIDAGVFGYYATIVHMKAAVLQYHKTP